MVVKTATWCKANGSFMSSTHTTCLLLRQTPDTARVWQYRHAHNVCDHTAVIRFLLVARANGQPSTVSNEETRRGFHRGVDFQSWGPTWRLDSHQQHPSCRAMTGGTGHPQRDASTERVIHQLWLLATEREQLLHRWPARAGTRGVNEQQSCKQGGRGGASEPGRP